MSDLPRLGPEDAEYLGTCGFSAGPGAPRCQDPAEVHLLIRTVRGGADYEAALPTCLGHYAVALAVGEVVDRHRHAGVCGLPGVIWDFDLLCCRIDDSGQEPKLRALADATIGSDL